MEYFESVQGYEPPFELMLDGMRIACFGSEADNLLMWSHYADGLRGFCIVFDEDLIVEAEPQGHITDVAYLAQPPVADSFVYAVAYDQHEFHMMAIEETNTDIKYLGAKGQKKWLGPYQAAADDALDQMKGIWQQVFAAKPKIWEYERERRLLVPTDHDDRTPLLRPFPQDAVKEVIFGERMDADYLARLRSVIVDSCGDIPVKMARRSNDTYSLLIE